MTEASLVDWLFVSAVSGLGPLRIGQLLEHMDVSELRQRLEHEPKSLPIALADPQIAVAWRKVDAALAWQQQASHHYLICRDTQFYPPLLQQIPDPPPVLFLKGCPDVLLRPAVAMVGSRAASHGGLSLAFQLAAELDSVGLMVVSGMAAGIDGAAHKGALSRSGQTVAVLGTGVEQIYPKGHRQLYEDIQQHGAVISEFWPSVTAFAGNFPKRNRIISGLALGTLVVEARRRSGSLISARTAMEQGREVFAVPGAVLGGDHQGCHDLIKNGAKLVESLADIVEELSPLLQSHLQALPSYVPLQTEHNSQLPFKTLLASVGYETTPLDVVVEQSGITLDLVLEQLLELELQGWVAAVPGGYVRLKRN
jgi:DNA processing protein